MFRGGGGGGESILKRPRLPLSTTQFRQGAEREDCFDDTEGLEFLTSEVGLEAGTLTAEGAEIAALVGYQKV